ncbi:MAG: hypothetical protein WC352_04150 [Candidatus Omnitrophota bacterium]|jgi:hypothetical protein
MPELQEQEGPVQRVSFEASGAPCDGQPDALLRCVRAEVVFEDGENLFDHEKKNTSSDFALLCGFADAGFMAALRAKDCYGIG